MAMIQRILYVSKSTRPFSHNELMGMCSSFASSNEKRNITGLLLYVGRCFVQIIEGPMQEVGLLISKIELDIRHNSITILSDHYDSKRAFGQWSMQLIDLNSEYYPDMESVAALRDEVDDTVAFSSTRKKAIEDHIQRVLNEIRGAAAPSVF